MYLRSSANCGVGRIYLKSSKKIQDLFRIVWYLLNTLQLRLWLGTPLALGLLRKSNRCTTLRATCQRLPTPACNAAYDADRDAACDAACDAGRDAACDAARD